MFILTKLADLVQIKPHDLEEWDDETIKDTINEKYANKVLHKIGLCICLHELLYCSDGMVGHGTGTVNINVEFTLIVFRPFKGEVIQGKITSTSEQGIKIGVEFFNDIHVPPNLLFPGSRFHVSDQIWIWTNEGTGEYYFDIGEVVKFRVEAEEWHDQSPGAPMQQDTTSALERKAPYSLIASMAQGGLGIPSWW